MYLRGSGEGSQEGPLWLWPWLPQKAPAEHCSVVEGRLLAFGVSGKVWAKFHGRWGMG